MADRGIARLSGKNLGEIMRKLPAPMAAAMGAMQRAMWTSGTLGVELKEMLRLKTAELAGCEH